MRGISRELVTKTVTYKSLREMKRKEETSDGYNNTYQSRSRRFGGDRACVRDIPQKAREGIDGRDRL
jgi:hypothetical protein